MNKIFKILYFLFILTSTLFPLETEAKLNIFAKPRYIPELSFYNDIEKRYTLKDFQSDLLIVILWSKKCGPCISEIKYLPEFVNKTKDEGIKVILISPENEWKTTDERQTFITKIGGFGLDSYIDKNSNFAQGMGVFVTPTVLLVNNKTEEVGQITGTVKWDDDDVIKYLIKLKNEIKVDKS